VYPGTLIAGRDVIDPDLLIITDRPGPARRIIGVLPEGDRKLPTIG